MWKEGKEKAYSAGEAQRMDGGSLESWYIPPPPASASRHGFFVLTALDVLELTL